MFFKTVVFFAILAVAFAVSAPEAKADPKAKPWLAYSSPLAASAPVAYTAGYSAPLTYAASPLPYNAYPAYSAYSYPYASPYIATVF